MPAELETAGAIAGGGWLSWRRKHAEIPPGTPCGNCETPLQGAYCHTCGQMADDFHKSIWKLFVESFESLFHFDGRMWRTLPDLVRNPGRLTRAYLDGKRAYQIPPFRLFLVLLLVAFFVGHQASKDKGAEDGGMSFGVSAGRGDERTKIDLSPADHAASPAPAAEASPGVLEEGGTAAHADEAGQIDTDLNLGEGAVEQWVEERLEAVQKEPGRFLLILEIWAHRVAILALPISAMILTLLFVFQRRFFVFDHLVFSMHSLSFQLILLTTIMALGMITPAARWLALLAPVHLFMQMRGVYGTSIAGTLIRMVLLWALTVVAFSLLAILWLYLGIAEMGGH